MNLGLMPVTGLPLPFLSYGGSSMFACWLAIGLVAAAQRPPRERSRTAPGPAIPVPAHRHTPR
jgi:rod shape determining protein RodA